MGDVACALRMSALMEDIVKPLQNYITAVAVQALKALTVLQTLMSVRRISARIMLPVLMVSLITPVAVNRAGRDGCECICFSFSVEELKKMDDKKLTVAFFRRYTMKFVSCYELLILDSSWYIYNMLLYNSSTSTHTLKLC
jgi:hypothetical protein